MPATTVTNVAECIKFVANAYIGGIILFWLLLFCLHG